MNAFLLVLLVAATAATVAHADPCSLNQMMHLTINSADDILSYQSSGFLFRDNAHIILNANIDFSKAGQISFPLGGQGSSCKPFIGVFDGNGYTISNVTVNTTGNTENLDGALFCKLRGACVRNVVFDETCKFVGESVGALAVTMEGDTVVSSVVSKAYVEGSGSAGGLIATGDFIQTGNGELNSCTVSGTVKSIGVVGGLMGTASGASDANLAFRNCTSTGLVQIESSGVAGGLLGALVNTNDFDVVISESTRSGVINATGASGVGGFIGTFNEIGNVNVSITDSVHDGTIFVNGTVIFGGVGGFIGYVNNDVNTDFVISNSTNNGDITVQSESLANVGGFVGGCIDLNDFRAHMDFCTNNGPITVTGDALGTCAGGLVGQFRLAAEKNNSVTVSNCENSGTVDVGSSGVACGFFSAAGFNEGLYTGDIYNSVNKGRLIGGNAFGIADEVTSARLVVSMGSVEGTAKSRMFWDNVTLNTVSELYVLRNSSRTENEQATEFEQSEINRFYFPVSNPNGPSLDNVLQNLVRQDARNGGKWTGNLGMTNTPAVVTLRLFFDVNTNKSVEESISTVKWTVKSGETLSKVEYLDSFFANDKCIVVTDDLLFPDVVVDSDITVDIKMGSFVKFTVEIPSERRVNASFVPRDEPVYTKETILEEVKQLFPKCSSYTVTPDSKEPGVFAIQLTTTKNEAAIIARIIKECSLLNQESTP